MKDSQGDVFNLTPPDAGIYIPHYLGTNRVLIPNIYLDPHVRVLESHEETINGETIIVIDRFEVIEVSIVP